MKRGVERVCYGTSCMYSFFETPTSWLRAGSLDLGGGGRTTAKKKACRQGYDMYDYVEGALGCCENMQPTRACEEPPPPSVEESNLQLSSVFWCFT
uniref:Uncharacterized protein n=1 Tax=Coccidioides posadasii RMSCC 3488 TaxID=454284 RepID=A0A0J6FA99_COCPO|nr:hypothetical protein CPAG_03478 [Coccidioides posadasii RMSCC 3488]